MIIAFQSDEPSVGNAVGKLQAPAVHDASVVAAVKNESGHAHLGKPAPNIDFAQRLLEADRISGGCGDTHQLIHPSNLLRRAFGNETAGEHLAESRIVLAP